MLHQVNRLQFEATCTTEAQAFEVRHNLSQTYQQQVAEVIDKVCSRHVSEEEWIKIDSIEIDLGSLTIQSYQNNFSSLLLEKFEKELCKKINAIPPAEKSASKQIAFCELLIFFLQTGTVPWWADNESVDMDAIFTEVITGNQEVLYSFLQQHRFTTAIWQRIAMQFKEETQHQVISLFPGLWLAENKITQWVSFLSEQTNKSVAINLNDTSVVKWQQWILLNAPLFFNEIKEENINDRVVQIFANEYSNITNSSFSSAEISEKILAYEAMQTGEAAEELAANPVKEKLPTIQTMETPESIMEEKFTIYTAGTVLLAPYFKQLFTNLNLLEGGQWKNPEAQYKAIHLIRFMATGQLMCAEHTLVLEKLLCGMEITAPIPRDVILKDEEKAEAMDLLKAVIANWEKIKNTSVEGLREAFLKRDGLLTKKENGWLLQVERKTLDVLLDSIPWSFATLAFTWNNYIIFTEW